MQTLKKVPVQANITPKLHLGHKQIVGVRQGRNTTHANCVETMSGVWGLRSDVKKIITGFAGKANHQIQYTLHGRMLGGPIPVYKDERIVKFFPGFGQIITGPDGRKIPGLVKTNVKPGDARILFWANELCVINAEHTGGGKVFLNITLHALSNNEGVLEYVPELIFEKSLYIKDKGYKMALRKELDNLEKVNFWLPSLLAIQMGYAYHGEERPDVEELRKLSNEQLAIEPLYFLPLTSEPEMETISDDKQEVVSTPAEPQAVAPVTEKPKKKSRKSATA